MDYDQRYKRNQVNPEENQNARHPRQMTDVSGQDQTLPNPNVHGNPQVPTGQPRYSDGYTIIPPNESKRNKMKTIAQKEEEALNRWKETQRVPSVCVNPERLGGDVTLAEVRQKQQINHQSMKLQKKVKKAEDDKRKRQEEEEKLQKMKAIQREKAERLLEKERQEDQRRREEFEQDRLRTQERFLQNFERKASSASTTAIRTSSRQNNIVGVEKLSSPQRGTMRTAGGVVSGRESTDVEGKQTKESRNLREVQLEHKRVNAVFLDKLEGQARGSEREPKFESTQEAESQAPLSHLKPDPEQSCSGWTEEADPRAEYDQALMKLIKSFPNCDRDFLEDIFTQCNRDYEEASTLLISTLS
ncbi:epithelial-stromal interaction protein 1-like [Astatotilapia calliptera]|uniref:epithelial-stromal interaction protein 1-like n=1 Tax=Astatotilapia calliptera TaxID=8154 RepID=UPI000E407CF8|nr:epithelial-stromal interaction protein 1-like [Astatotilapia calliptera]